MALVQDSTGYYLEPTTGQYYSSYTAPVQTYHPFGNGMGIGMGGFYGNQYSAPPPPPEGLISYDGKQYVPFSGNVAGISQGKRSVVDALVGGRHPYQYNVPSLASMFPSLQGQMQGQPQEQMPMQGGGSGVGRFMGGLLNSMPTPVSSTTTQAPASSGAGRFL